MHLILQGNIGNFGFVKDAQDRPQWKNAVAMRRLWGGGGGGGQEKE